LVEAAEKDVATGLAIEKLENRGVTR